MDAISGSFLYEGECASITRFPRMQDPSEASRWRWSRCARSVPGSPMRSKLGAGFAPFVNLAPRDTVILSRRG